MEGITSKDQERAALHKIRKIVESLGENSYIAAAFDGCFELAEENIENDFACSQKQEIQALKNTLDEQEEKYASLEIKLQQERELLEQEKKSKPIMILQREDLDSILGVLREHQILVETEIQKAAEQIVMLAERPADMEFQTAVKHHRYQGKCLKKYEELIRKVHEQIQPLPEKEESNDL